MANYDKLLEKIKLDIQEKIDSIVYLQKDLKEEIHFYQKHFYKLSYLNLSNDELDKWCDKLNDNQCVFQFINFDNPIENEIIDENKNVVFLLKEQSIYSIDKFKYSFIISGVFKNEYLTQLVNQLLDKRLKTDDIIKNYIENIFYTGERDALYKEYLEDENLFELDLFSRINSINEGKTNVLESIQNIINSFNEVLFEFKKYNQMLLTAFDFLEER